MRPGLHDSSVEIPLTIDVPMQYKELNKKRLSIGVLTIIGTWLICIAFCIAFGSGNFGVYIFFAAIAIGVTIGVRQLYLNEGYYKKRYDEMLEHGYKYDCTQVWEIYEISPKFPICHFKNGSKALFVMFDKDVIVGKDVDTEYYHYEAIANAYQMIASKGIECMHIDYMDTVGKDNRFDPVVNSLLKTKNQDLQQLLSVIFEYQTFCMSHAYSTYDVYAFYYKYDDSMFKDDIELIIGQFLSANYKRYRILQVDDIRELMKSIYNIDEFSVLRACDSVFRDESSSELIRVIWTERDGIRTVLNKTAEEQEEQKQQNKKNAQNKRNGINSMRQPAQNPQYQDSIAPQAPKASEKPKYFTNAVDANDAYIYDDDTDFSANMTSDFSGQSYEQSDYDIQSDFNQSDFEDNQSGYDYNSQYNDNQSGFIQDDYNNQYNDNAIQEEFNQSDFSGSYTDANTTQEGFNQSDFGGSYKDENATVEAPQNDFMQSMPNNGGLRQRRRRALKSYVPETQQTNNVKEADFSATDFEDTADSNNLNDFNNQSQAVQENDFMMPNNNQNMSNFAGSANDYQNNANMGYVDSSIQPTHFNDNSNQSDEDLYAELEAEDGKSSDDNSSTNNGVSNIEDILTFNPNNVAKRNDDYSQAQNQNSGFSETDFNASDFENSSDMPSANDFTQSNTNSSGISTDDFDDDDDFIDLFGNS